MTRFLVVFSALSVLACTGAGAPKDSSDTADTASSNPQDVRGVYDVEWSDLLHISLDIGGVVQEAESDGGDVVTFEGPDGYPLELDIGAWCADPSVTCPSEAWPGRLAVDEDDPDVVFDAHTLRAWDADAPGAVVTGLVNHTTGEFLFGLGSDSGSSGDCGALSLSLAGGTFAYDDPAAGPVGIDGGQVAMGWLGVCAWSGLAVAATLSVETDFTAEREGDLP